MKLEFRAITNKPGKLESEVMMSSIIPSAKYSCSGSPLMFWNGRIAIEGFDGGAGAPVAGSAAGAARGVTR